MSEFKSRFPGYDVLRKRNSPSWNEQTRQVIAKRLQEVPERKFFDSGEWETLVALCNRIIPQPDRPEAPVPIAPFIDSKMHEDKKDGYRYEGMPSMQESWKLGLKAIDDESRIRFGTLFRNLSPEQQDDIIRSIQEEQVKSRLWQTLPPKRFFTSRVLHDIPSVYYAHPESWNEIGFGGPASPRGYFRLGENRSDPWEALEAEHE